MKTYKFKVLSFSFLILILSGNLVKADNTTANKDNEFDTAALFEYKKESLTHSKKIQKILNKINEVKQKTASNQAELAALIATLEAAKAEDRAKKS